MTHYQHRGWYTRVSGVLHRFWSNVLTSGNRLYSLEETYCTIKNLIKGPLFDYLCTDRNKAEQFYSFVKGYPSFEWTYINPTLKEGVSLYEWFEGVCKKPEEIWRTLFPGYREEQAEHWGWALEIKLKLEELCLSEGIEYMYALREILQIQEDPAI